MADFFDYLDWRGDISIDEIPFSAIDMLLLSQITYCNLDGLIEESFINTKSLSQVAKDFKNSPDYENRKNTGVLINKRTSELLLKAGKSKRFKNIKLGGYVSKFSEERNEQFAAVTFFAGNETIISYRGTDDTIVGWREDFNLAYMDEIPAQKSALDYFAMAADTCVGEFTIIGHSKGGNLAVNTGVKCKKELQERIKQIYNFDGPGFKKEFFESTEYKNIEKKLFSFYPQFSVVGMIFEHPEKYKILKSTGFAIMEHDAITWQLMGRDFITVKKFDDASNAFRIAFNDWISKLTKSDCEKFINGLFEVLQAPGLKTIDEINKNALSASAKMISAFAGMDKITKSEIRRIIGLFRDTIHTDFPLFKIFGLKK